MLSFGSPTRGANLDQPQQLHLFDPKPYEINIPTRPLSTKQTFLPEKQTLYEPPSDVVIYDIHPSGIVIILAQQSTNIPDVAPRPSFFNHKKGKHPKWEAMMLGSYIHEKSEAGKIGYDGFKGAGILV